MSNNSANDISGLIIGLLLILLLFLIGGLGFLFVTARQQMAVAAERARAENALARAQAEQARAVARRAGASRTTTGDDESSKVQGDVIRAAVESVLRAQEDAGNRGDLDAFMDHYWKSDDLTSISGGKIVRGWNATLARYRERYPTSEKMDRLSVSGLEITPLGDSAALVVGQWKVDRESEPLSGNFSLVLRKINDRLADCARPTIATDGIVWWWLRVSPIAVYPESSLKDGRPTVALTAKHKC